MLYVIGKTRTACAICRNYPVVGRFRCLFEELGEFFRQYFFALDREEMPFNRAQRSWVYRAAKGVDNTVAFGSTLNLSPVGTRIFANCPYPTLEKDSISPNRHPEIDTAADLLDMINHLRNVSGLPVGFKAVIGAYGWLDELFAEILDRGVESAPDFITVDSGDGGTGAAPMSLIDNVGLTIRESLPLVVDKLNAWGLRERIRVIASGKLINPADAAWALCVGADFVVSARGFMFALGCIQALQCNKNTCPTGVTTHDRRLQRGLVPEDKAERVCKYAETMRKEIGVIAHSCGVPEPRCLRRYHCRIVQENGRSVPLDELYPDVSRSDLPSSRS